jgi:hypothetical protein
MMNQKLNPYDYYRRPGTGYGHRYESMNCPPDNGLTAAPAKPWEQTVAEHNADRNSHPYLLGLIKNNMISYYCKDTVADRDDIQEALRMEGLMVYVVETDTLYRLQGGISNENWVTLDLTSDQYIKVGRLNPPTDAEDGSAYFDLTIGRLRIRYEDEWVTIPTKTDLDTAILKHEDDVNAHADRFAEVENKWYTI